MEGEQQGERLCHTEGKLLNESSGLKRDRQKETRNTAWCSKGTERGSNTCAPLPISIAAFINFHNLNMRVVIGYHIRGSLKYKTFGTHIKVALCRNFSAIFWMLKLTDCLISVCDINKLA